MRYDNGQRLLSAFLIVVGGLILGWISVPVGATWIAGGAIGYWFGSSDARIDWIVPGDPPTKEPGE